MSRHYSKFFSYHFLSCFLVICIILSIPVNAEKAVPDGPYLGQKPPGKTPQIFAPGIISTGETEGCCVFTNNGKYLIFKRSADKTPDIFEMECINNKWTKPRPVPFQGKYRGSDFTFDPAGKVFYFAYRRPIKKGDPIPRGGVIWTVEKTAKGWTQPKPLGPAINTGWHVSYPCVTNNGTMYYFTRRLEPPSPGLSDIYLAKRVNGKYPKVEKLGDVINTEHHEWDPYIAPDESYMIFCSTKPGGFGSDDLYITFRKDGKWTKPVNMGKEFNSPGYDNRPFVTADGKYFFYTSQRKNKEAAAKGKNAPGNGSRDVYWVDASVINDFKAKALGKQERPLQVETENVNAHVYMISGDYGNMLVSKGKDGFLLVDTKHDSMIPLIEGELKKLGNHRVKYILNTHFHGDHIGGNKGMAKDGAVIIAHENVRERMQRKHYNEFFKGSSKIAPKEALPTLTFKKETSLHFNGDEILMSHFPGHTDGDSVVFFRKANVVHLADLYFNILVPSAEMSAGGSLHYMIDSLNKLMPMLNDKTKVVPGHGPVATKKELQQYIDMLTGVRDKIVKGIADGKTSKDMVAAKLMKAYEKKLLFGWFNLDRFVQYHYIELSRFKDFPVPTAAKASKPFKPVLYAPGIISDIWNELNAAITPDQSEIFFSRKVGDGDYTLMHMKRSNGGWAAPVIAPFCGKYSDVDPSISPDGKKMLFASSRPFPGKGTNDNYDIWIMDKTASGWSTPYHAGPKVNSPGGEVHPVLTKSGNLYFASDRKGGKGKKDIYRSKFKNGRFSAPVNLGKTINTADHESDCYVDPSERFLIFCSTRPGGQGKVDLYISFNKNGKWTAPKNMGKTINTAEVEYAPMLSPDGKTFFFTRKGKSQNGGGDVYHISAKYIEQLKK